MGGKQQVSRRWLLRYGSVAGALTLAGCQGTSSSAESNRVPTSTESTTEEVSTRVTPGEGSTVESTDTTTGSTDAAGEWKAPIDLCRSDPDLSAPGPLKSEFVSREKYQCAGRPLANFETLDAWTADAGSIAFTDREEYDFKGSGAAELRSPAGEKRVQISRPFEGVVDLSRWDLSIGTQLATPSQETLIVQVLAPDRDNKLVSVHPTHAQWGWVRLDLGHTSVTGSPDLTDVRGIRIGAYTGADRTARLVVDSLRATPKADTGRAILTFDDNSVTQYETALPILQEHDYPAVAGVAPWDIGETPRDMTIDQLRDLQSAGWDIASYPKRPGVVSSLPPLEQEDRIRKAKQWLVDHGFDDGARFLVWPSTDFDHHSLRIASRYHYLGFTDALSPTGQLPTSPTKITRTPMNEAPLSDIKRFVDLADRYDQLVVLTAHGIGDGDGMVTEAKFESVVRYLSESGVSVDTASALWEDIR